MIRRRGTGPVPRPLLLILGLHGLWAAGYILGSSGDVGGRRTFLLFDDTMVSMRYARLAAAGLGPVWNPGERVEGFSNPLWTAGMTVLHLLPLPPDRMSLPVQLLGLLLMSGTIAGAWRLAALLAPRASGAPLVAALLVAGSLALNRWALLGTEVALVAWLATTMAVRSAAPGAALGPVAALAALVRMDGALLGLAFAAAAWLEGRAGRRRALTIGAWVGVALLLQTAARFAYYGDWLPNTYWLKMSGYPVLDRVTAGARMLAILCTAGGLWLAIPALATASWRHPLARRLAALCLLHAAYSVWVGGDAWDGWGGCNRFQAPAVPAFCALVAAGWSRWPARLMRWRAVAPAVWLLGFNAFAGRMSLAEWTLQAPAFGAADNLAQARLARRLAGLTRPDARIAVVRAGTLPYLLDRRCIDLLGKCDRRIARLPAHTGFGFYPGHLKWDYAWSLGDLRPDVIVQIWHRPADAAPFLRAHAMILLGDALVMFRRGSPRVDWAALTRAPIRLAPGGPRPD